MSKYVQHRSGDGEKWEVLTKWEDGFNARTSGRVYYLPSSEYVECSPPETWVDATDEFKVSQSGGNLICKMDGTWLSNKNDGYRLRKVSAEQLCGNQWAFIVEKRQP